jgi:hypothetical protein
LLPTVCVFPTKAEPLVALPLAPLFALLAWAPTAASEHTAASIAARVSGAFDLLTCTLLLGLDRAP